MRQLFGYILNQQTAYLVLMYYDSCLTFGRILELLGITMNRQRLPNMDVRHVPLRQDVELRVVMSHACMSHIIHASLLAYVL